MTQRKRLNIGTIAIIAGWVVTSLTVFWQIAIKDATYSSAMNLNEIRIQKSKNRIISGR